MPAEQTRPLPDVIHAERGGYELVLIRGGTFVMGSPETEDSRWEQGWSQHEVTLPDFYLGRYEVTNEEYGRFLKANPDYKKIAATFNYHIAF